MNNDKQNCVVFGGRLERLVVRLKAIGVLLVIALLFWLPLVFATREIFGFAWRWIKDDVPHEYRKWANALTTCAIVIITGLKIRP